MAVESEEAPVELSIETGPHAGVKRRLAFGAASMGRGLSSDIVLADESMVEAHAMATLSGKGVAIEALGSDVVLGGDRGVLRSGETRELPWPVHMTLGRTRLTLDLASQPGRATRGPRSSLWPAAGGAAVLVAAVLLGSQYLTAFGGAEPQAEKPKLPEALNLKPAVASQADAAALDTELQTGTMPSEQRTLEAATESLERQMDSIGLEGLKVQPDDGAVVVSGLLSSDDEVRWRDVEMWFDQRFGSSIPLDSRVSVDDREDVPDIAIRAVWSGPSSYLVAGDGRRYSTGSMMPGGWRIDAIEPDAVVFQRDRQTFRFKFGS